MGQYFKLVNSSRKEWVDLPGGMKAIERVSDAVPMGMIGYLLLDGPGDGTAFLRFADPDDPKLDEQKSVIVERELEHEASQLNYTSMYRDDDGEWDESMIARTAAAHLELTELMEYAGRWAGDDVRLVGDYDDSGLYQDCKGTVVVEHDGTEYEYGGDHPKKVTVRDNGNVGHTRLNAKPGDQVRVYGNDDLEEQDVETATFVRHEEGEYTDITDGLIEEFTNFVGKDWIENHGKESILRPDMVIQS